MTDTLPEVKTRIGALWSLANIVHARRPARYDHRPHRHVRRHRRCEPRRPPEEALRRHLEAMYNTAFGLAIALVCMVGHLLLSAAMKKVVADLEAFSLRFENLLADSGAAAATSARARRFLPRQPGGVDMQFSAQRVRSKTRAAIKRREDDIEQDEIESGELNLIPYLDMVTNLMLFLLASVSAGLILVQIDTTLPDKAAAVADRRDPADEPRRPAAQAGGVDHPRARCMLWSITGLEGTLHAPKQRFSRSGRDGEACDGTYMCESQRVRRTTPKCIASRDDADARCSTTARSTTRCSRSRTAATPASRARPRPTRSILMADGATPYATIVSRDGGDALQAARLRQGGDGVRAARPKIRSSRRRRTRSRPTASCYDTDARRLRSRRRWRCSTTSCSRRGSSRRHGVHAARSAPHHPQGRRPRPRGRGHPPPQHHADDGHDDDPARRLHLPGGGQRHAAHRRHGRRCPSRSPTTSCPRARRR